MDAWLAARGRAWDLLALFAICAAVAPATGRAAPPEPATTPEQSAPLVGASTSAPPAPASPSPPPAEPTAPAAAPQSTQGPAAAVEAAPAPAPAPAPSSDTRDRGTKQDGVTPRDGQRLVGRIVSQSADTVTLALEPGSAEAVTLVLGDGAVLTVPLSALARVEAEPQAEPAWTPDPNRSRYLYSPTAFSLGQGHGYISQRAVVITSVGVGVLSALDLEAGTVLPTLFSDTPIAVVGAKAAAPFVTELHAGLGAQAFFVDDVAAGFFFANTTFGNPDKHLTLAAGGAMEWSEQNLLASVVTISGNLRVSEGVALISENWVVFLDDEEGPWGGPLFIAPSFGVRLFGARFAVDLALVPFVTGEDEIPVAPLPWVSFAWNFPGANAEGASTGP